MWLIIWIEAIYFKYFKIIDFCHISFHFITSSAQWQRRKRRKKPPSSVVIQPHHSRFVPFRIFSAPMPFKFMGMNFILTFRALKLKWNWCHFEDLISKFILQISLSCRSSASLQLPPQLNWIHVIPLCAAYYFLSSRDFFLLQIEWKLLRKLFFLQRISFDSNKLHVCWKILIECVSWKKWSAWKCVCVQKKTGKKWWWRRKAFIENIHKFSYNLRVSSFFSCSRAYVCVSSFFSFILLGCAGVRPLKVFTLQKWNHNLLFTCGTHQIYSHNKRLI